MKKSFVLFFTVLALIACLFSFASCNNGANTGSESHGGNSFSESNSDNESPRESLTESVSQSEKPAESESTKQSVPEEEGYTITFDSAGGTSVPSQKVLNGKKIKKPDAPTKLGYTFTGWFVSGDEWNFLAYTVTDDMTLTAGWAANTYVISFDVNGGKTLDDMNVTYNSAFVLPVPEKDNSVFLGWEVNGELFENGVYAKTENITLTAKWGVAVSTITFDVAGGSAVLPMKVNYGESYVLPKSQKSGYVFAGWTYNGEFFKDGTILSGDITLVARWEGLNDIFKFESSEKGVAITEYVGNATDVIVPAEINDQPVIAVKEGVFANNSSITSVVFDGTFESYTEKMFAGCSSLKSLTISGVFDKALWWLFGDGASSVPASFTEISFALNSNYIDGSMFKNWGLLAKHTITYVIPYGTEKIYPQQYEHWTFEKIVIPNSVTSIEERAFFNCCFIEEVTIPGSILSIGEQAFYASSLKNVIIEEGVKELGRWAFADCGALENVVIPDSVTFYKDVFENCGCLESEGGIIYVGNRVLKPVSQTIVTANIRPGTRGFAYDAFSDCGNLKNVTIPNGVINISGAFSGCTSLVNVVIPNGVTDIGGAFYGCSSLTGVTIPDSVATIGERAFSHCDSLTSVEIPSSVTSIEIEAFAYCGSLKSVILSGVTSIGEYAFFDCGSLTSVTISSGITSIERYAFNDCSSLTSVTFNGTIEQWKSVKRDFSWRSGSKITIIKCSDGDVAL